MSDVVPIKMDFSECDFDDEAADEDGPGENGKQGLSLSYILSIGGAVFGVAAIIFSVFMFAKNGLPSFGKPHLDNVEVTDKKSTGSHGGAPTPGEEKHEYLDITAIEFDHSDTQPYAPDKKKRTKSNDKVGKIVEIGDATFYYLNPVAVSNKTSTGNVHIYVTLAFETSKESADALHEHGIALKDELVSILRSMDSATANDWDAPHTIRSEVRHKLAEMLPDATIEAILVQDFVVF